MPLRAVTELTTWGEFIDLDRYYKVPDPTVQKLLKKVYLPES